MASLLRKTFSLFILTPAPSPCQAARAPHSVGETRWWGILAQPCVSSLPPHHHAEILLLLLEQPLVGIAKLLRRDAVGDESGEVEPAVGHRCQQPALGLVDVPRPGQASVSRLEEHVA